MSDCSQSEQAPAGSWTITLTSVVPAPGPPNDDGLHFVAHGTVAGTLPTADGDGGSVTLTATF